MLPLLIFIILPSGNSLIECTYPAAKRLHSSGCINTKVAEVTSWRSHPPNSRPALAPELPNTGAPVLAAPLYWPPPAGTVSPRRTPPQVPHPPCRQAALWGARRRGGAGRGGGSGAFRNRHPRPRAARGGGRGDGQSRLGTRRAAAAAAAAGGAGNGGVRGRSGWGFSPRQADRGLDSRPPRTAPSSDAGTGASARPASAGSAPRPRRGAGM